MVRQRSERYMAIRGGLVEQLNDRTWRPWGPRWRNRVGLQRMTAAEVGFEAARLLGDVNLSTHRDDAELRELLEQAREAASAYASAVSRDNWDRLQLRGKHAREDAS
jgi:hypothetical protein